MEGESDRAELLGEVTKVDADSRPRNTRIRRVAAASLACLAVAAAWKSSRSSLKAHFSVNGVMTANERYPYSSLSLPAEVVKICNDVSKDDFYGVADGTTWTLRNRFWPHRFDDVNWQEDCDANKRQDCESGLVEKYVGDYFDKIIHELITANTNKGWVPSDGTEVRELARWKSRVIENMQEKSKHIKNIMTLKWAPLEWAYKGLENTCKDATGAVVADCSDASVVAKYPADACPQQVDGTDSCSTTGTICDSMNEMRPAVPLSLQSKCRPNYDPWFEIEPFLRTFVPEGKKCNQADGCQAQWQEPDAATKDKYKMEASYDATGKTKDATNIDCTRLLRPLEGEDWISATLTAIEMRQCVETKGVKPLSNLSRSWVRNCMPGGGSPAATADSARTLGWPGYVLEFIDDYQIVGSDCVKDYDGKLGSKGICPSTCEDGSTLVGQLKREEFRDYTVIFNQKAQAGPFTYFNLEPSQVTHAKYLIWDSGPLVGLVEQTVDFMSCKRFDTDLIDGQCKTNWDPTLDVGVAMNQVRETDTGAPDGDTKKVSSSMASVTVYGWGQQATDKYWLFVSSFHAKGKMEECGVKLFVVFPESGLTAKKLAFYDSALKAFKADSVCKKPVGFCDEVGAGYTDTEDCDGDGVLDHWCYMVGGYEGFISSRVNCDEKKDKCRRSVLPGRTFGCQRPLGWCMHGENYRRDVDCDGDGHFDHICEAANHHGFISSSQDCIDTWEKGDLGTKCESVAQTGGQTDSAAVTYKFVRDSGDCVATDGGLCFKSHAEWPVENYKPSKYCSFHVEAEGHLFMTADDCGKELEKKSQLVLERWYEDIESAEFDLNGNYRGDKFTADGKTIPLSFIGKNDDVWAEGLEWRPRWDAELKVYDKVRLEFQTDATGEKEGWLVCLREKKPHPKLYKADCTDTGDVIWSKFLDLSDKTTYVSVECDMDRCNKGKVRAAPITTRPLSRFYRTTNICDAGWNVLQSNRFDLQFFDPETLMPDSFSMAPSFEVLAP